MISFVVLGDIRGSYGNRIPEAIASGKTLPSYRRVMQRESWIKTPLYSLPGVR